MAQVVGPITHVRDTSGISSTWLQLAQSWSLWSESAVRIVLSFSFSSVHSLSHSLFHPSLPSNYTLFKNHERKNVHI